MIRVALLFLAGALLLGHSVYLLGKPGFQVACPASALLGSNLIALALWIRETRR